MTLGYSVVGKKVFSRVTAAIGELSAPFAYIYRSVSVGDTAQLFHTAIGYGSTPGSH